MQSDSVLNSRALGVNMTGVCVRGSVRLHYCINADPVLNSSALGVYMTALLHGSCSSPM